jgi:hypothetical protein
VSSARPIRSPTRPEADDIGRFVTDKVQTLPGVKDTFTLVAYKAFA